MKPHPLQLHLLTAAVVSIRSQHILGSVTFTFVRAIVVDTDLAAAADVLKALIYVCNSGRREGT